MSDMMNDSLDNTTTLLAQQNSTHLHEIRARLVNIELAIAVIAGTVGEHLDGTEAEKNLGEHMERFIGFCQSHGHDLLTTLERLQKLIDGENDEQK